MATRWPALTLSPLVVRQSCELSRHSTRPSCRAAPARRDPEQPGHRAVGDVADATATAPSTTPAALARTSLVSTARVSDQRPCAASTTMLAANTATAPTTRPDPRPHGQPDEHDGERPHGDVDDGVALGQARIGEHIGGAPPASMRSNKRRSEVAADPPQRPWGAVRQHQHRVEQQRRHAGERSEAGAPAADDWRARSSCDPGAPGTELGGVAALSGPIAAQLGSGSRAAQNENGQSAVIRHGSQLPERWYKA